MREFEQHLFQEAPVVPATWWNRIVVVHKQLRGWNITPSQHVGQELTDVWLDR